jgi:NAD(P)-dependent dehydrogenase (short-subunit alcohol dehydrogenase family)
MKQKVWFITGASRGFGWEWTRAALERGDKVAACARNITNLAALQSDFGDALFPLELDVKDRPGCFAAVTAAHAHFGRLDVVVNNAGYGHFGLVEELTEEEARNQMETNFFGSLWVTQAALPYLRKQESGHLVQVSSIAGLIGIQNAGIYTASKFAVEGLAEALAAEVQSFGVRVTLIEPCSFATTYWDSISSSTAHSAYDTVHDAAATTVAAVRAQSGDPRATVAAVFEIVDAEKPPLRTLFGTTTLSMVRPVYLERLRLWDEMQPLAEQSNG